jgi:ribosomal protein S18 acetylase RimI-like enzyme
MDIEVRLAGKNDLKIIHEILGEIQGCRMEKRAKRFEEALNSNLSTYLVAITEGKVVGYLNTWQLPDLVDGEVLCILLDCYVSREFRRRGVGRMLLDGAMEEAEKHNANKYYVWMDFENKSAISLLKKHGFSTESLMLEKR